MSKKHHKPIEPQEEMVDEVVVEEPIAEIEEKHTTGKVVNCELLNVREQPNVNAEIVCMIKRNTEVEIDVTKSTSDFYKICIASGIEGFCMKKFILVD